MVLFPGSQHFQLTLNDPPFICHLTRLPPGPRYPIPYTVSASIAALISIILLPLEIWTGWILYHNWATLRNSPTNIDRRVYLAVYIKLGKCTSTVVVMLASAFVVFVHPGTLGQLQLMVYPLASLINALVFCTQKDLLNVYLFCKKPSAPLSSIIFHHDALTYLSSDIRSSDLRIRPENALTITSIGQGRDGSVEEVITRDVNED